MFLFDDMGTVYIDKWQGEGIELAQVAQLPKHFSARDSESGKLGQPAQSVKTSLGQREKGKESSLNTVRLISPNPTI